MALLNASMLLGALFVAIPIVLHLTMRPRPKRMIFPAVRFVLPRRESNQRRLRWRHWILLALRCLAVLLVALALARPSVASQSIGAWMTVGGFAGLALVIGALAAVAAASGRGRWLAIGLAAVAAVLAVTATTFAVQIFSGGSGGIGRQQTPVAAVLVFDTSPRMQFRLQNKTRLQQAGDLAKWVVSQLPEGSEAAVLDSRTRSAVFSPDTAAAATAVTRLQTTYAPRDLATVISDALQLASTSSMERKELYIFTDLNETVWRDEAMRDLRGKIEKSPDVSLYVIDVGVDDPANVALGDVRLSSDVLSRDGELILDIDVESTGVSGERTVELFIEKPDTTRPLIRDGKILVPESVQRGQQSVALERGGRRTVQFHLKGLGSGTHQGQVRVLGQDGLAMDDVRYFAVQVQEAWPVLIAAPRDASMRFVTESLAPYDMREQGTAMFDCAQARVEDLDKYDLKDFAAVFLLDPPPLEDKQWEQLAEYVQSGRGLAIALGSHADSGEKMNTPAAQQLLPGTLVRQWRSSGRDIFLAPDNFQHPITASFREDPTSVPWNAFAIFRHWEIDPLAEGATSIVRYNNGQPAIIERLVGAGKVITLTTPLSDVARPVDRLPWNELAYGESPWPQFIVVNEMMLYLVASGEVRLNYRAGQTVVLPHREQVDPERFQLFPPLDEPYDVIAGEGTITVRFTDTPGAYRLKGNRGGVVIRGFAVNTPVEASNLARIDAKGLDELFGKGRMQLLRQQQQIERAQGRQRVGREFYPLLVVLAAMILGLEHTLANRFYRNIEA